MFRLSVPVGRVAGIPIRLHLSWSVVFVIVTASIGAQSAQAGATILASLAAGATAAFLLLASVLLHELGHCAFAIRYGIHVRRIQLFIFGGVAEILGEPRRVREEIVIAAAGPAVSFALAGIAYPFAVLLPEGALRVLAEFMLLMNVALGTFNLIPAFPTDGGRIFRAVLWALTGDYRRATRWAANAGLLFAGAMILSGLFSFFRVHADMADLVGARVSGTWFVFIGLFLGRSARAANAQGQLNATLREGRVADVLYRATPEELSLLARAPFPRVNVGDPLDVLVGILVHDRVELALVYERNVLIGTVSRTDVGRWLVAAGP